MKIFQMCRWYADIKSLRTAGLRKRMKLRACDQGLSGPSYRIIRLTEIFINRERERAEEFGKHILSTCFVFSELDVAAYKRSLFRGSNERLRKRPSNKRKCHSVVLNVPLPRIALI